MKLLGVHIHPSGRIHVRGETESWTGDDAAFAADFAVPAPALPDGAVELIHDPGRRTVITTRSGETEAITPRPEWDAIVGKLSQAVAARIIRQAPPPEPPPPLPEETPTTADDLERILTMPGVILPLTQVAIDDAKRNR